MARFYFSAQNAQQNVIQGDIDANDRDEAIALLGKRGLSPLKVEILSDGTKRKFLNMQLTIGAGRLSTIDEINLVRHLGTILNTGTDLLSGLEMIGEDAINPFVKKMVFDVKERVSRGERFSDALMRWQDQFNPIFISLVKAGEASGTLPSILMSYAAELRKDYSFARRLKGAMIYPVILICALAAMLVLILTVVTPRLKELFASTQAAPPFYTQIFFTASDIWLAHYYLIISLFVIAGITIVTLLKTNKTRRKVSAVLYKLPFLNNIQKNLALMRLCKALSSLLKAGFSLKAALGTASGVAHPSYRETLELIANQKLERGISLGEALNEYPKFFPKILVSVVKTGEKSGQLSAVLGQMGEFYEEEVLYALELFLTLIEPILLLIVGLIVGTIASSLISPIYRLIGNIH